MLSRQKYYPNDLLDLLSSNGSTTRAEAAKEIGCSIGTVSRLRHQCLVDGYDIGYNGSGYIYFDKRKPMTDEIAKEARSNTDRQYNSLITLAHEAENHNPVAIKARRHLAKDTTRFERNILKAKLLKLTAVIDVINLDEDLDHEGRP